MTASAPARVGRSEFIQVGRFVAAGLVLVTHSTYYYGKYVDGSVQIWHWGEIGVPIFFVISGIVMVMSSTRLKRDASGAREFSIRRLVRIVPLYWLATTANILIFFAVPWVVARVSAGSTLPWADGTRLDVVYAIKSYLFVPAYNSAGRIEPIHGVGWTLLHEMFFYALFALVMLARGRPQRWVSGIIVGLFAIGWVAGPDSVILRNAILNVMTSPVNLYFVIGMAIGSAIVWGDAHRRWTQALTGGLLVGALVMWLPGMQESVPLKPLPLALGAAMLVLTNWRMLGLARVGVALGNSSYSLYLFHPLIAPVLIIALHKVLPLGAPVTIIVTWFAVVAIAHGIYLWVENPMTQWAKRLFHRFPRPAPAPPVDQPEPQVRSADQPEPEPEPTTS